MLGIIVTSFVLLVVYKSILHPHFLSALADIPSAHPLSSVTSLWIQWMRFSGQEVLAVNDAFRRKGAVVRLGPNDIAVNTIEGGVKTVYDGGFDKPDWYNFWSNNGWTNTFSSLGKDHIVHRRRLTNAYAKSSIQRSSHIRRITYVMLFERLVPQLMKSAQSGRRIDVLGLNMAYGLDYVSAFIFGLPRGTNFIEDTGARDLWLARYLKSHPNEYMFWLLDAPKMRSWLSKFGVNVVPLWVWKAREDLDQWALRIVNRTEEAMSEVSADDMEDGDFPVVYNQLRLARAKEDQQGAQDFHTESVSERPAQLASECLDHLVATRDVFGIAYSFVIFEIAQHPDAQRRLYDELVCLEKRLKLPLLQGPSDIPSPKELESLPYLNDVIKESLRLRGTLPTPNPRVTPKGKLTTIGEYKNIPGGVRINSFAWCLHRNETVYPNPEEWIPERWLGDLSTRKEQEKWFWTFGSGSSMCLGDNLAMEMIRYAVATLYSNFSIAVIEAEGFGGHGQWVTGKGEDKLVLQLEEIDRGDGLVTGEH